MKDLRIEIDDKSGFCFGVVRAISEAEKALAGGETVYSLGDIVHNRIEVQRLERAGLHTVAHGDMGCLGARGIHRQDPACREDRVHGALVSWGGRDHAPSNTAAIPCPPPMHIVSRP